MVILSRLPDQTILIINDEKLVNQMVDLRLLIVFMNDLSSNRVSYIYRLWWLLLSSSLIVFDSFRCYSFHNYAFLIFTNG